MTPDHRTHQRRDSRPRLAGVMLLPLIFGLVGGAAVISVAFDHAPAWGQTEDLDLQERQDAAYASIAECFAERQDLAVLFLMDESGSLQRTDPDHRRVPALKSALTMLDRLRLEAPEGAEVEVALSAYATDYTLVRDWTSLDASTLGDLLADADAFEDRNRGLDTDFALGLDGTADELERHVAEAAERGDQLPCRAIYMFTDGDYDIEPRSTPETRPYAPDLPLNVPGNPELVEEAGRALVCEEGGIIDRLRATDAPLISVIFTPDIAPEDRDFVRSMSLGRSGEETCGTDLRPEIGAFTEADDIDALVSSFWDAMRRIEGGLDDSPERELLLCDATACEEGRFEFELDGSLRRASLLTNLIAEGVVLQLEGPNGEALTLDADQAGTTSLSGADLAVSPISPTDLIIDLDLPSADTNWIGTWSATFIDTTGNNVGAATRARLILFGELEPEIVGTPELRLGEPGTIEIRMVSRDGSPRTPDELLGDLELSARIFNPATGGEQVVQIDGPSPGGVWTVEYTPPMDLGTTRVNVGATLQVTTPSGLALPPSNVVRGIDVLPPVTYPRIEPGSLALGSLLGGGSVTGTISVIGGEAQEGCVWFEPGPVEAPRYAGAVEVSVVPEAGNEATCLEVGAGETIDVEVTASVDEVDSGSASFPIAVFLRSEASPEILEQSLPASFDMVRDVDQLLRLSLLAAFLLPGFLLPLLLMYLFAWLSARFIDPGFTLHATYPVRLLDGEHLELHRENAWGPFRLEPTDFRASDAPAGSVRHFETAGLQFRARISPNPFGTPYATASSETADTIAVDGATSGGDRVVGITGFAIGGAWVLVLDPVRPGQQEEDDEPKVPHEITGILHVFRPEEAFAEHGAELEQRIIEELPPTVVQAIRTHSVTTAEADAPTDSDNADSGVPESGAWTPPTTPGPGTDVGGYQPPSSSPPAGQDRQRSPHRRSRRRRGGNDDRASTDHDSGVGGSGGSEDRGPASWTPPETQPEDDPPSWRPPDGS